MITLPQRFNPDKFHIKELKQLTHHNIRLTVESAVNQTKSTLIDVYSTDYIRRLCKKHYGTSLEDMKQYTY